MLVPRCCAILCLAVLAVLPGCTSLLAPRSHKMMKTTRKMAEAASLPAALPRELEKQVLPEYRVAPGDVLLAEPVDFNSSVRLPADQKVLPDGTIDLNQYGRLVVTGMSLDEIRTAVERRIAVKEGMTAAVHVQLMEPESQVYYVIGEVNSPAAYPVIGTETVLDALLMAGGLTDGANRHNIVLSRPTHPESCRSVLPICYRHIVELGDASTNYQIMPGDRIYVPSEPFTTQLFRTIFPTYGERCPRCAGPQFPCPPGAAGTIGKPIIETAEQKTHFEDVSPRRQAPRRDSEPPSRRLSSYIKYSS